MIDWNDKPQVIKGNFAEKIVRNYLENKGYVVYTPQTKGKHCFDMLAVKDKKIAIIAEIKAKAKLNKYPETGIDANHYEEYKFISQQSKLRVFIFFADEMLAEIYGNYLDILEVNMRKSPWNNGAQVLFKMEAMIRNIYKMNDMEVAYLRQYSTRKHEYDDGSGELLFEDIF